MMKTKVTITLDPLIVKNAKRTARLRKTNLSAMIEGLLAQNTSVLGARPIGFSQKWAGKFEVRESADDELLNMLKKRYELDK